MTKLDKRTIRRILREELESLLNVKITKVEYSYWEGSGTVTEWCDLTSFYANGELIETTQNDDFSVDFTYNCSEYNIPSIATIEG